MTGRLRHWFGFSKAAWVLLGVVFVAARFGPLAVHMAGSDVLRQRPPLVQICGTRGPWVGSVDADGKLRHPAGEADTVFHPGDLITWESCSNVTPGTTVSGEFTLWCDGRPVIAGDSHVYAEDRREGWKTFGLTTRTDTPLGHCGVRREGTAIGVTGERETWSGSTLSLRMAAP